MDLMDMTVKGFVDELASSSPAPGGGTIAAVSGAFAAGLGEMICTLTLQKNSLQEIQDGLLPLKSEFEALKKRLLELADEDTQSFNKVMAAFRLPKGSAAEVLARKSAIAQANLGATLVPLETAMVSVDAARGLSRAVSLINANVMSDCGVAMECAKTAALGAIMNVAINLPGIKDEQRKAEIEKELLVLKQNTENIYNLSAEKLNERFSY